MFKNKGYKTNKFCFEFVGEQSKIMDEFEHTAEAAGYISRANFVNDKGNGFIQFSALENGKATLLTTYYRPEGRRVYVTAIYLGR